MAGLAAELQGDLARGFCRRAVADVVVQGAGKQRQPAGRDQQLPTLLQGEPAAK